MARISRAPAAPFYKRLVLADWFLAELGVVAKISPSGEELSRFQTLAEPLHDLERRLQTQTGQNALPAGGGTPFCALLLANFPIRPHLSQEQLEEYDQEIALIWRRLARERRAPKIKYFQWLALLNNAVYLDRFLSDPDALLGALNAHLTVFNAGLEVADHLPPFKRDELNTLSFWCATGSGKTLMMHGHLLQFLAFNARHAGQKGALPKLDHIFLLTPDSDLSAQHIGEAQASGIKAAPFKAGAQTTLKFDDFTIETLENTKIRDPKRKGKDAGPTTFDIEWLGGTNLVLVDEGHLGAGGEVWMSNRRALAQSGFCYEYSATFGQVVSANPKIAPGYAKNIALDYSYRQFYRDGYGKEFRLFNLPESGNEPMRDEYLCGALLAYDAQLRAYDEGDKSELEPFGFARPLWVFVGNSVGENEEKSSDVVDVLRFVAGFLANRAHYSKVLKLLVENRGVLCERDPDVFEGLWGGLGANGEAIYDALCARVFGGVGGLSVRGGANGELHLGAGENAPFGLIYVGKPEDVLKAARKDANLAGCVRDDKIVGAALFADIDSEKSTLRLLVGARKFITGWNAYRVATLGLMNIGRGEGPQIIQLFGRGVRLRGLDHSLMRAAKYGENFAGQDALRARVERLETLQIFGLQADYMKTFLENLRLDVPVEKIVTFELLTRARDFEPRPALQTLYLPGGRDFESSGIRFRLGAQTVNLGDGKTLKMASQNAVSHDLFGRLESGDSRRLLGGAGSVSGGVEALSRDFKTVAPFLDFDALRGNLRRFKEERGYHALEIPASSELRALLENGDWFDWKIPSHLLGFDGGNFAKRRQLWRESALALLRKFAEWSYKRVKAEYERGELRLKPFEWENDRSWETAHTFTISDDDRTQTLRDRLEDAKAQLAANAEVKLDLSYQFGVRLMDESVWAHLYRPLVVGSGKGWKVTPVVLDKNETEFIERLCAYRKARPAWFENREIYVLRNKSRVGVGFFEEGGFFPDFLVWIIEGNTQTLAFVDPKGLRNVSTLSDPKVTLHTRIRDLEGELGGQVRLRSFLVSNTALQDIQWARDLKKTEFENAGVFFQSDDEYLLKLLDSALS